MTRLHTTITDTTMAPNFAISIIEIETREGIDKSNI